MEKIGIIMGSKSDWKVMKEVCITLELFGVEYTKEVVSAHRTPGRLFDFAKEAKSEGYSLIIAGAGGAAHLPGMVASLTTLPVIGVPIKSSKLNGIDSLLSIVQMPSGVPVASMAIDGAKNAALFAVSILAISSEVIDKKYQSYRKNQTENILKNKELDL
ncbi:MAG: N5-carboxyaminoimidazole ribonucleotide mutase [Candidatus Izimaplasma bacterium HR2]|nr:MAG: N5-carboxyaminoimidazole ribonucleotide mutase [Candidatus Izimaplasma bacterium HR2]